MAPPFIKPFKALSQAPTLQLTVIEKIEVRFFLTLLRAQTLCRVKTEWGMVFPILVMRRLDILWGD